MKYGILGGTFDPPHTGHLHVALEAKEALGLDEVIWIPANQNPNKSRKSSSAKHRFEMCRLAVTGKPGMAVSDIETTRGGPSFLVDTLEELTVHMPGTYWFILGADALGSFEDWKEPGKILQMCRLAVIKRPGTDMQTLMGRLSPEVLAAVDVIEAPAKAVSSSDIRDAARKREDYSYLVEPSVYGYIKEKGLYSE